MIKAKVAFWKAGVFPDQSKSGFWRAGFFPDQSKSGFLEGRLFSANHGFLKTFQIALIDWIIASS